MLGATQIDTLTLPSALGYDIRGNHSDRTVSEHMLILLDVCLVISADRHTSL
jgi:hypothetical protein